jgi:hypothetical protein
LHVLTVCLACYQKYSVQSAEEIEVFTPESREIPPQFSAVNYPFMGIMLRVSRMWETTSAVKTVRQ